MKLANVGKKLWTDGVPKRAQPFLAGLVVIVLCAQHSDSMAALWDWYKCNREPVISLATGIGGLFAIWVAFGQFQTARLRHEEQTRADLQRRITETFIKATEQLGSEKIDVRLGGIYTLERISKESPVDYWPVMETLCAFVRGRPRAKELKAGSDSLLYSAAEGQDDAGGCPTDIQAVLTVIGRRHEKSREHERMRGRHIDLSYANLQKSNLTFAHLEWAFMVGVHLEGANLIHAGLENADISNGHLERAYLVGADLRRANLRSANFEGANLQAARIDLAQVAGADLRCMHLPDLEVTMGDATTILPEGLSAPGSWVLPTSATK
jgi:hypothetical protein